MKSVHAVASRSVATALALVLVASCGASVVPGSSERAVVSPDASPSRPTVKGTPMVTPSASGSGSSNDAARPCIASDLEARLGAIDGGAGSFHGSIELRNASQPACTLQGYVRVALVDSSGQQLPTLNRLAEGTSSPLVLLPSATAPLGGGDATAGHANVVLAWNDVLGSCVVASKLVLTLPDERSSLRLEAVPPRGAIGQVRVCSDGLLTVNPVSSAANAPAPTNATGVFASICGTISDYVPRRSFVLNAPDRAPLAITLPVESGSASGYVCVQVVAGAPHPIFAGFFTSGTPGFVASGQRPATAASPSPGSFLLPQACAFVASPVVGADQTSWSIDCGATNNDDVRGFLGRALAVQGWMLCATGAASAQWRRGGVMLGISESSLAPGDYPRLDQFARLISPCS